MADSDDDEFEDEPWTEEDEAEVVTTFKDALTPMVTTTRTKEANGRFALKADMESKDDQADARRDATIWERDLPETRIEAKFWGNQGLRLLRGITRQEIRKLSVKDRVLAASVCFDKRQVLLDRPTTNIHFGQRLTLPEQMEAVRQELERRNKERQTIDVTPLDD